MLFELLLVPLWCSKCEENTEHLVRFFYYNSQRHTVTVVYYCQGCFDLAYETSTKYTLFRKEMEFKTYKELCDKYGELK